MRWLLLLAVMLLLNACSDDAPSDQNKERVEVELMPCTSSYIDVEESQATRAWTPPTPYVTYDNINSPFKNQKNLVNNDIDIFFTQNGKEPLEGTFFYRQAYGTSPATWRLSMEDITRGDYYLYGFIPKEDAESATIAHYDTYEDGAVLTIHGLNTVTPSDVCVLIGAKEGSDGIGPKFDETTDAESNTLRLRPGAFKTVINTIGEGSNFVYLLFDHIYAALRFRFKVDPIYGALRTIRLRRLELIAYKDGSQGAVSAKFDAVIKLKANTTGGSPIEEVTFTPVAASASVPRVTIFEWDGTAANEVTLRTGAPADFMGCFVPGDNTYFKLFSTYDVYDNNTSIDPKGNLIRQGCEAENTIDLRKMFGNDLTTTRGHSYSLTLTVKPTYLYMLSDPDLDNPTVTIN